MSSIDERIVKMIFDNDKFEAGVKATLETLDKLKEKLTFKGQQDAFKGLEVSANNVKLDGISSGVEALQNRFSTLGIVGMEVTKRLTNAAIDAGKKIANATVGQIKSGGMSRALNLEQARFQLQGILEKTELVDAALQAAKNAVDGTAYGFDEAAKAASVLAASGVKSKAELEPVLKSIAGAAAMTGRQFSDISDIYSTVASNGKLMTMQLRQFAASGLNVSAVLAEAFKTNEETVNEMVRKGEISFEQFSQAMLKFSDDAAKANETFSGSMANMKSALSRIGELFAGPYVNNMIYVFNSLREAFNNIKESLIPLADRLITPAMERMRNHIVEFIKAMTAVKEFKVGAVSHTPLGIFVNALINSFYVLFRSFSQVKNAFKEVFPNATIENLKNVIKRFHDWTGSLVTNKKLVDNMNNAFKQFFKVIFAVVKLVGTLFSVFVNGIKRVLKPFGGLINVISVVSGFIFKLIYNIITLVTKTRIVSRAFTLVTKVIGGVLSVIIGLYKGIKKIITAIVNSKPVKLVVEGLTKAFKACSKFISNFVSKVKELSEKFVIFVKSKAGVAAAKAIELLKKAFDLAAKAAKTLKDKLGDLFESFKSSKAYSALTSIKDRFKDFIDSVKNTKFIDVFTKAVDVSRDAISKFVEKIKEVGGAIADWVKEHQLVQKFFDTLSKGFEIAYDIISKAIEKIKDFFTKIYEYFKETGLLDGIVQLLKAGFEKVKDGIHIAIEAAKKFAGILEKKVKGAIDTTADSASEAKDKLSKSFPVKGMSKAADGLLHIAELIKNAIGKILEAFDELNLEKAIRYFDEASYGIFLLFFGKFVSRLGKAAEQFGGVAARINKTYDVLTGGKFAVKSKWQKRVDMVLELAVAVFILAKAVETLGRMDIKQLGQGIGGLAAGITILSVAMVLLSKGLDKLVYELDFVKVGAGMLLMAGAMLILSIAIKRLGSMKFSEMAQGLGAVAGALIVFGFAIRLMGNPTFMDRTGNGIMKIAAAMFVLFLAISLFSKMKFTTYAKGLALIAGALIIFAIAARAMIGVVDFASTGKGIFKITVALLVLYAAIKLMSSLKWTEFAEGIIYITISLAVLSGAVAALSAAGNADLKAASKAIVRVTLALILLTVAIKILSTVDTEHITAGLLGFAAVLAVMTIALSTLSNIKTGLAGATLSIVAIAAALTLIAAAIKSLGSVPFDSLKASFVGLIVLLIAMTGALLLLSEKGGGGLDMIATAAAFIALSLGIMVLAAAVKHLADVDPKTIAVSLFSFAGAMILLAVAGTIAEAAALGLAALAAVLLAVGVVLLSAAMSVKMFTDALVTLNELGPEAMSRIVEALVTFITELAANAVTISAAALTLILAFIGTLMAAIPALTALGLAMIVALLAGIAANIGKIAEMAILIVTGLIAGIARGIGPLIQAAMLLMVAFIVGLANGIRSNAPIFFAAVSSLLESLLEMVLSALQTIVETIPVVGKKISKGLEGVKEGMREAMGVDEANEMLDNGLTNIENTIADHTGPVKDKMGNLKDEMLGGFGDFGPKMGEKGQEGTDALVNSLTGGQQGAFDAGKLLEEYGISGAELGIEGFGQAGTSSSNSYNEGLASGAPTSKENAKLMKDEAIHQLKYGEEEARDAATETSKGYASGIDPSAAEKKASDLGDKAAKALDKAKEKAKASGEIFTAAYAKAIESKQKDANKAGKSVSNQASSGTGNKEAYNSANTAGINLGQGFIQGINLKKQDAYNAGFALGQKAAQGVKDGEDAASPSKLGIKAGKYLGEGLIIGINSMTQSAYRAGYNIGEKASDALTDAMSRVYDVLNSDIDSSPKITPVIDLSAAKKGVGQLDSMFSNKTLSTAALARRPAIGMMGLTPSMSKTDTTNNVTNTFNITVDGAENPEAFADRLLRQVSMKTRMGMA